MNFPGKRKIVKRYTNGEITVIWKPDLCNHSTICFSQLPGVFKPADRPWIDMNGASTEEIIKIVEICPTLALTWEWNDKEKNKIPTEQESSEAEPECIIRIVKGGPALIRGRYKLIDMNGKETTRTLPMSICRCGLSKKSPLCDGSHTEINFSD